MIILRDLTYHYADGTAALKDINLTIHDGEFLLICGPNGSGKTTLLRHLNGLLKPSSGSVEVEGLETSRHEREIMQRVGMVFQDADTQIIGETVEEDVAFGPQNLGLASGEVRKRVDEVLAMMALEPIRDKPCHRLSGGQKRRVAIAGVLAMRPQVLLIDEPFANLDYAGVRQTLEHLVTLHRRGKTVVVTTHDVEKVMAHADRVVVLHEGLIKTQGPPGDVISSLRTYGIRPPCFSLPAKGAASWLEE